MNSSQLQMTAWNPPMNNQRGWASRWLFLPWATITSWRRLIPLASLLLYAGMILGCSPDLVYMQASSDLRKSQLRAALNAFADPGSSDFMATTALMKIVESSPHEPPDYWIQIVNDERHTNERRMLALSNYLNRHMSVPSSLRSITRHPSVAAWFNENTVYDDTSVSYLPFPRGNVSVFGLIPTYTYTSQITYSFIFVVYPRIYKDGFLDHIRGVDNCTSKVRVIAIYDSLLSSPTGDPEDIQNYLGPLGR